MTAKLLSNIYIKLLTEMFTLVLCFGGQMFTLVLDVKSDGKIGLPICQGSP